MKNIITGLIAIAAFSFSASAQSSNSENSPSDNYNRERGEGRNKWMEKLNLSEAQKDQMKAINQDSRNKMEALKQNTNLSEADMQSQRKRIEEDKNEKIAAILSQDQRNQWEQMRKERREQQQGTAQWNQNADHGQAGQGVRGEDRMEQMKTELGLSDDQMARLKSNNESFRERGRTIMNNQSMSQEDKKIQFEKLRMERQESMRSILTPDQMTKMESNNKGRKEKYKVENGKEKIKVKDNN